MFHVSSEIKLPNSDYAFPVVIYRKEGDKVFTSLPLKRCEDDEIPDPSVFEGVTTTLSYFFGDFSYELEVNFEKKMTMFGNEEMVFEVKDVEILNNYRESSRDLVNYPASLAAFKSDELILGNVLDISEKGMRIEVSHPIDSSFIELHYVKLGHSHWAQGEIVWEKRTPKGFMYGLSFPNT